MEPESAKIFNFNKVKQEIMKDNEKILNQTRIR